MNILLKAIRNPRAAINKATYLATSFFGSDNYQPFLVLTRSRTGSTLLTYSLDSHPAICCRGELLNHLRGRQYKTVLQSAYGKHPGKTKAAGFKMFYYHPSDADGDPIWETIAAIKNLKIIHLRRENILRTLVSRKIAEADKNYQFQQEAQRSTEAKAVTFDPKELEKEFESTDAMEKEGIARFSNHEVLEITYEEMIDDRDGVFARVQRFLGVNERNLSTSLKKQNPELVSDLISNFSELQEHFKNTKWERFFKSGH